MQRATCSRNAHSCRFPRRGFFLVVPVREMFVICLFAAVVFGVLFHVNAYLEKARISGKRALNGCGHPVRRLEFDAERETLVVQTLSSPFKEISLIDGSEWLREIPPYFFSFEASETNSTMIMMSQFSDGTTFTHGVQIIRDGIRIVSEELTFDDCPTADVRISAEGTTAVFIGSNGMTVGWDLTTDTAVRWEYRLANSASTNKLSPDGCSLVNVGSDGTTAIYDTRTGDVLARLPRINECSREIAWSHDNRLIALADAKGMTFVFDASTGAEVWHAKQVSRAARVLRFSPDNRYLVVAGFDKMVWFWNWKQKDETPRVLYGASGQIGDFVFTESGKNLIVGCTDGTIREWSIDNFQMIRQIR